MNGETCPSCGERLRKFPLNHLAECASRKLNGIGVIDTPVETEMLVLKGKIYEIGNLEGGNGRGMRIEADGEEIAITGMTEDECRVAAQWLGEEVSITIQG